MNATGKARLWKLLDELEVSEVKLPEKCASLVEEFKDKFSKNLDETEEFEIEEYENPFVPNSSELEEIDSKIIKVTEKKKLKRVTSSIFTTTLDPKRPWRIHTNKEKLLRIDNELKRHHEKSNDLLSPILDEELSSLISAVETDQENPECIHDAVELAITLAKKSLPNFQYRAVEKIADKNSASPSKSDLPKMSASRQSSSDEMAKQPGLPAIEDVLKQADSFCDDDKLDIPEIPSIDTILRHETLALNSPDSKRRNSVMPMGESRVDDKSAYQ